MADTKLQMIYDKAIGSIFVLLMGSCVTFLWDVSRSITILNKQVAVVIEQVSGNEKNVQIQIKIHEKQIEEQNEKIESLTDQLRILNSRMVYITSYINRHDNKFKEGTD